MGQGAKLTFAYRIRRTSKPPKLNADRGRELKVKVLPPLTATDDDDDEGGGRILQRSMESQLTPTTFESREKPPKAANRPQRRLGGRVQRDDPPKIHGRKSTAIRVKARGTPRDLNLQFESRHGCRRHGNGAAIHAAPGEEEEV